jgi:hypothetical protein
MTAYRALRFRVQSITESQQYMKIDLHFQRGVKLLQLGNSVL